MGGPLVGGGGTGRRGGRGDRADRGLTGCDRDEQDAEREPARRDSHTGIVAPTVDRPLARPPGMCRTPSPPIATGSCGRMSRSPTHRLVSTATFWDRVPPDRLA